MTDKQKSSVQVKHLSENTTEKFALAEKKKKTKTRQNLKEKKKNNRKNPKAPRK